MTLKEARPVTTEQQAFVEMALDRIQKETPRGQKSISSPFLGQTPDESNETWMEARGRQMEKDSPSPKVLVQEKCNNNQPTTKNQIKIKQ